jgi:Transposase DDE domain group 1
VGFAQGRRRLAVHSATDEFARHHANGKLNEMPCHRKLEGKLAVKMTRPSCHRFRANEVRLWLSVIAYNLGNLWRRLALPAPIGKWSLTSLQQRLAKTGGRLIQLAAGGKRMSC